MTTTAPVPEIQVADVDQETAKEETEEEVGDCNCDTWLSVSLQVLL